MRLMARISIPVESGNEVIRSGALPKLIQQTAEQWKPEAMYFGAFDGRRNAFIVFDMPDSSGIPAFAEPFFSGVNADVQIVPIMNAEDLQKGLAQLG